MSVMGGQDQLGIQERTVAAGGYAAANPVFRIRNLPHELKCHGPQDGWGGNVLAR